MTNQIAELNFTRSIKKHLNSASAAMWFFERHRYLHEQRRIV